MRLTFPPATRPPTRQVHYLYYGNKPSPRRRAALAALHPLGLTDDWADKLRDQSFIDDAGGITYEHYMQVGARLGAGVGCCVVGFLGGA